MFQPFDMHDCVPNPHAIWATWPRAFQKSDIALIGKNVGDRP
jgi:hypothetical protein